jgi:SAM-dependent methyltransferase
LSRKNMSRPSKCPVCQSNLVTMFLKREQVPVHQNLVMKDQRSALEIPRGDLNLVVCGECGFIFNQAFEPFTLSYGEDYDNTQTCSPLFNKYIDGLVGHLVFEKGIQNCRIVEVGCGKGLFLRNLIEVGGNIGYGFDPSYVGPVMDLDGRLHFEKRYYGPECAETSADVIVCRHVIEHIPNPLDLLRTIRQTLANSPRAKVFFETPTVEWILQNQIIWDFFYEHCSYFSADSLTTAFEATGFKIESIQNVFGGQYLWLEATLSIEEPARVTKRPGLIPNLAKQFALSERKLKIVLGQRLQSLVAKGKVALWGAGAKGVTLANLVDPELEWIACVVDLNPGKQGFYIPGTGHPIVGYQELAKYGVETAILMNPNYREENLALLQKSSLNINLIDLMDLVRGDA